MLSRLSHKIISLSLRSFVLNRLVRTFRVPELLIIAIIDLFATVQVITGERTILFVLVLFLVETFVIYLSWAVRYLLLGQPSPATRSGILYEWAGTNRLKIIIVDVVGLAFFVLFSSFLYMVFFAGFLYPEIANTDFTSILAILLLSLGGIGAQTLLILTKRKSIEHLNSQIDEFSIIKRIVVVHISLFVIIMVYSFVAEALPGLLHAVTIVLTILFIIAGKIPLLLEYWSAKRDQERLIDANVEPIKKQDIYNTEVSPDQTSLIR